jgi:hypothetical protein
MADSSTGDDGLMSMAVGFWRERVAVAGFSVPKVEKSETKNWT